MSWSPDIDAELLRLRDEEQLKFSRVALKLGKSRGAVLSRYYRLIGHGFPSDYRRRLPSAVPMTGGARLERIPEVRPAKYPYAPDCSCPDFAWDDDHCDAVLAAGGFPILERRAA